SGTWIGRRSEDATHEDALRYIQGKAFRTGQEMRHIRLGLPGAVGGGTVTVPNPPSGGFTQSGTGVVVPPEVGGAGTPPNPPTTSGGGGTISETGEPGGTTGIGVVIPPLPIPAIKNKRSEEPATGINLSGCFETWDVPTNQAIETAWIEFSGLTVQQIKQILQRIPSTFKATLEIAYKDGGEQ
ncbi:MAG: hypothetical protein PHR86_09450, partial [Desulfobacterales bacterium]|nr:hypothetical protein [Desulfobacterales bacterium]